MDVMREPGRDLSREIAAGEAVEHELDAFITRRDRQRRETEGERAAEELWEASSRLPRARRTAAMRAEWCEYHRAQAERHRRNLGALVAYHEAEAKKYRNHDTKEHAA